MVILHGTDAVSATVKIPPPMTAGVLLSEWISGLLEGDGALHLLGRACSGQQVGYRLLLVDVQVGRVVCLELHGVYATEVCLGYPFPCRPFRFRKACRREVRQLLRRRDGPYEKRRKIWPNGKSMLLLSFERKDGGVVDRGGLENR